MIPTNPAFQRPNIEKYRPQLKVILQDLTPDEKMLWLFLSQTETEMQLIESETPQIIADIQKRGVKTVALTGAFGGVLDGVDLAEKRILELKGLGIDFSVSFGAKRMEFKHLKPVFGSYPLYDRGILFACGDARKSGDVNTKGDVLISFLNEMDMQPKVVLMVDDKIEFLNQVQESLSMFDPAIKFIGLQYTGALNFPSEELVIGTWTGLKEKTKSLEQSSHAHGPL